jgi:hypothetical protein
MEHGKRVITGQALVLWLGAALYTLSFFLYAVGAFPTMIVTKAPDPSGPGPFRGWSCAYMTLVLPVVWHPLRPGGYFPIFQELPWLWGAMLISGWINPLVMVTLYYLTRDRLRIVGILRVVLILMIPCCVIVFTVFQVRPLAGFFLWIGGMVIMLWSRELVRLLRLD